MLYILRFLHQTTTFIVRSLAALELYILRFLHQTTTARLFIYHCNGCISCVFYIKPQLYKRMGFSSLCCISCVFYIKPQQSVQLVWFCSCCISCVFYIKPQLYVNYMQNPRVVYLAFSTSNHNPIKLNIFDKWLYILRFLHQTTTIRPFQSLSTRCISCVFYIKPQPVKLLNLFVTCCISCVFYIKPQRICEWWPWR